mmetsp:Transcript_42604/g.102724  ORF Transcript_42604/g.102724 Transcript_42604/m.102724 type:complete len:81 (-) Transcript_42604:141-383(-)
MTCLAESLFYRPKKNLDGSSSTPQSERKEATVMMDVIHDIIIWKGVNHPTEYYCQDKVAALYSIQIHYRQKSQRNEVGAE